MSAAVFSRESSLLEQGSEMSKPERDKCALEAIFPLTFFSVSAYLTLNHKQHGLTSDSRRWSIRQVLMEEVIAP